MLKDRIKQAIEQGRSRGLTQAGLAAACSVKPASVSDWVSGKSVAIKSENVWDAAAYLGVEPRWLATGRGAMRAQDDDWNDILGYKQAIGLGDGEEAAEYVETHNLKFRKASLDRKGLRPGNLAVVYGRGDSMWPRIRNGDAILFDTTEVTPKDDKLFIVYADGPNGREYSAKRCRDFDGLIFFDSLNPDGDHGWKKPRRMDDPRRPITIIGRVRWIGSWED